MSNISLEPITLVHLNELIEIARKTYFETFEWGNTAENMQDYLDTSFAESKMISELTNHNSFFYFAKMEGETVGYLKLNLNDAQTELQDPNALEIERIYVLNEFQGCKIGQFLFDKALEFAKNHNKQYIWLGVWEKNEKALAFYKKNHFEITSSHVFIMGDDHQTDFILRRSL